MAHVSSEVDAQCCCCAFSPLLWLKARIRGFIINHDVLNALDICVSDSEILQRDFLKGLVSVCWRGHRFKCNLPIRSKHLVTFTVKRYLRFSICTGWKSIRIGMITEWSPIYCTSRAAITGLARLMQRTATDIGFLPFSD